MEQKYLLIMQLILRKEVHLIDSLKVYLSLLHK